MFYIIAVNKQTGEKLNYPINWEFASKEIAGNEEWRLIEDIRKIPQNNQEDENMRAVKIKDLQEQGKTLEAEKKQCPEQFRNITLKLSTDGFQLTYEKSNDA